jgi:hypothetical protein
MDVALLNDPKWIPQGPSPIDPSQDGTWAGAVESIAVIPAGAGYGIYAGTVNGGIWHGLTTINQNGQPADPAWIPMGQLGMPSLAISSMALDPTDPSGNTLWAATGSLSSAGEAGGPRDGLVRIGGGGTSYTFLGKDLQGTRVQTVLPTTLTDSVTGKQVVLVADYDGLSGAGLLRSSDGGTTFQPVIDQDSNTTLLGGATSVVADPNNPNRFFAAIATGLSRDVYMSSDGGVNWTDISSGNAQTFVSFDTKLAVTTQGSDTLLYAATSTTLPNVTDGAAQLNAVFQVDVTPGGQTTWTNIDPGDLLNDKIPVDVANGHFAITTDPANPQLVYISAYESNDYRGDVVNNTWTNLTVVNGSHAHSDARYLAFLNSNILLEADDGGMYALTNPSNPGGSDKWMPMNGVDGAGLMVTELQSVAFDPVSGAIFGGAQDNGTSLQSSFGYASKWSEIGGGDGGLVAADSNGVHYLFQDGNLYRDSTQAQLNGLNPADQQYLQKNVFGKDAWFQVAINPGQANRLLIGTTHIYESFNQGDNLTDVTPQNPFTGQYLLTGTVSSIAWGINNTDAAYVGTSTGQLFLRTSANGAFNATNVSWPWGSSAVTQVVVDPVDYHTAYVLAKNRVWQTSSAGATWTEQTYNLDVVAKTAGTLNVDTLQLCDPGAQVSGQGTLVVGALGGVFRLLDSFEGPYWSKYGDNPFTTDQLPGVLVTDLVYVPPNPNDPTKGDLLIAGTLGFGAWAVENASQTLPNPDVLQVTGSGIGSDAGNNTIRLVLNANNPSLLNVFVNQGASANFILAEIGAIQIFGLGSNNKLIVDETHGLIQPVHLSQGVSSFISWDGGGGTSSVVLLDTNDKQPFGAVFGSGVVDIPAAFKPYDDISYTNTALLRMNGGNGDDSFAVFNPSAPLSLNTGNGNDLVTIENTLPQGPVTVNLGKGLDDVAFSHTAENMDNITGGVTVHAGSGSTTLLFYDENNSAKRKWTLTQSSVARNFAATIHYDSANFVTIFGGSGNNSYNLSSLPAQSQVTLHPGPGNDTVNVGITPASTSVELTLGSGPNHVNLSPVDQNLVDIQGNVDVQGGGGLVTLALDDQQETNGDTWNITASSISRTGSGTITFENVNSLVVNGGLNGKVFDFAGLPLGTTVTLHGGLGGNTLQGPDQTNSWAITGLGSGSLDAAVNFDNIENLTGGADDDRFAFGPAGAVTGIIDGGGGTNKLNYSSYAAAVTLDLQAQAATGMASFADIQGLVGAGVDDTLIGPNANTTWVITNTNAGQAQTFSFSSVENLVGGTGRDIFRFRNGKGVTGTIAGGGGGDWLDYAAWPTPVTVNLAAGTATGVGGGISQIQNVRGGPGGNTLTGDSQGNVLIGGIGNDLIVGGSGPSILIGDSGADQITGGSVSGGDILIGGTVAYGNSGNFDALEALLAEWQSADSYDTRFSKINTGNIPGRYMLSAGTTVNDNGNSVLTGAAYMLALDWFFAGANDTMINQVSGEHVNNT